MKDDSQPQFIAFFAIVLWGATPAATQIAVRAIDAITVGLLRTVLGALILLPIAFFMKLPKPTDKVGWTALLVSALAGFIGYTLLFTIGVKHTSTTHAALILAAAPIFTGLIGFTIDRKFPRWVWWLGALIALIGEFFLVGYTTKGSFESTTSFEGDLVIFLAVVFASAGYVSGGKLSSRIGTWAATTWGISIAGLIQLPILVLPRDSAQIIMNDSNVVSWLSVIYLVVFTSIMGYAAWYWAMGKAGVARISPIQFTQPIISLVIAVIVFNEPFTYSIIIALATILLGVIITRMSEAPLSNEKVRVSNC